MMERHCRLYEAKANGKDVAAFGYDFESDSYLISFVSGETRQSIYLPQDAMFWIAEMYPFLLKYQAQCAPDGIGAEL